MTGRRAPHAPFAPVAAIWQHSHSMEQDSMHPEAPTP